jgi:hypothetical protein
VLFRLLFSTMSTNFILLRIGGKASPGVTVGRSYPYRLSSDFGVLPLGVGSSPRVPWTSSVALSRFVWAVQLEVVSGSGSIPIGVLPRSFGYLDTEA